MENQLLALSNNTTSISLHTGLKVNTSFQAESGFNYVAGIRELMGLIIVEAIAEGVGCSYLCGIRILNKVDNSLIAEINVPEKVHYSRRKCVELVSKKLLEVLHEAAAKDGVEVNLTSAKRKVESLLDDCYFKQSRESVLSWAQSLGII